MQIDYGLGDPAAEERTTYPFEQLRDGASIWVSTHSQRVTLMKAFNRWKARNGSTLSASSKVVGRHDPNGYGFRVFFKADITPMPPHILARAIRLDALIESDRWRVNWSGLETQDDIIAAILSTGRTPKTISEINAANVLVMTMATPLQAARMAELGRTHRAGDAAHFIGIDLGSEETSIVMTWPHDRAAVSPAYATLSDQQRKMLRDAGIVTEDEYIKALGRELERRDPEAALYAVLNGYSEFSTWKLNREAARKHRQTFAGSNE